MKLNQKQKQVKELIDEVSTLFGIDPDWANAIAFVESSLGLHQLSPTKCRGVFQMSSIAMKDLLLEMENADGDLIDIVCGIAFMAVLFRRHKSISVATFKYCDPNDRHFYWDKVSKYMREFKKDRLKI